MTSTLGTAGRLVVDGEVDPTERRLHPWVEEPRTRIDLGADGVRRRGRQRESHRNHLRNDLDPELTMTTSQYLLNLGLLAFVLVTNLGTRVLTRRRLLVPIAVVAVAGYAYLRDLPTLGNDARLELAGLTVGAVLGVVAALLVDVRRGADGTVRTWAGAAFAGLWIAVIGGRMLFAYGADHWFGPAIGRFSRVHEITGAEAWTAAFVLMALAMVVTRVLVTGAQAARLEAARPALAA